MAYLFINFAAYQLKNKKNSSIYEACFINIPHENTKKITQLRGKVYNVVKPNHPGYDHCVMTFWNFTHLLLYTAIGFFCPDLFVETMVAGFIFELAEYQVFDCHDALDLFYNSLGFYIGFTLSNLNK